MPINDKTTLENLYKIYPILLSLDNHIQKQLEESIIFKEIKAQQFLNNKLEQCEGFLLILDGLIKIKRLNKDGEETDLYNISQGEICHESLSCFFNEESLNIQGKALVDSTIAIIPFSLVNKHILKDVNVIKFFYKDLYKKFKNTVDKKEEITHISIDERLENLLKNKKGTIYMTHYEIASEIGTSREVVSRKLKKLEKLGYLKLKRGKIQILKSLNITKDLEE